jgi:hypothetical protein
MTKNPRGLLLLSSVLLALSSPAQASAQLIPGEAPQRAVVADTAQLDAIAQMLTAMKIPALLRHQMLHIPTQSQEKREVFQYMATHASDQDISKVLAPVYANYLTASEALQVAAYYRSSSGQRRADSLLIRGGALGGSPQDLYTDKEVAEYKRIDALPGVRSMGAAQKQLTESAGRALAEWSTRYYAGYRNKAMTRIAAIMRDALAQGEAARLPEPLVEPSGMAMLDKLMDIIARNCVQIAHKTTAMQKDVNSYGINNAITPARLVDAKGIAQSRTALIQADQRMERYLTDVMAQLEQYRSQVAEFAPDAKARANMDNEIAPAYTLMVRLAEVQRAMFDVFGRILDFSESRLGRIQLRDGRLVYLDEADPAPMQELMAQLQKVVVEAQQVAGDGKKMSDGAMSALTSDK